jgi:hypothetical protein
MRSFSACERRSFAELSCACISRRSFSYLRAQCTVQSPSARDTCPCRILKARARTRCAAAVGAPLYCTVCFERPSGSGCAREQLVHELVLLRLVALRQFRLCVSPRGVGPQRNAAAHRRARSRARDGSAAAAARCALLVVRATIRTACAGMMETGGSGSGRREARGDGAVRGSPSGKEGDGGWRAAGTVRQGPVQKEPEGMGGGGASGRGGVSGR